MISKKKRSITVHKIREQIEKPWNREIRKNLKGVEKIKDKQLRHMVFKSYIDKSLLETKSDIGTKVIMIINILLIVVNLYFILVISYISNLNPILLAFIEARIAEKGAENVANEFGINYENMVEEFSKFMELSAKEPFEIIQPAINLSVIIIIGGVLLLYIIDYRRSVYLKKLKEMAIELSK